MPHFSTAPVEDVLPHRAPKGPSQRSVVAQQYRDALAAALAAGQALVVELEPGDKSLTIRNRLKRAAYSIGREAELRIRRKGNTIAVYQPQE